MNCHERFIVHVRARKKWSDGEGGTRSVLEFKVNGKAFDETEIIKCYPKSAQLSLKALAQMILRKAENGR
jgi:hypothetical protein